MTKSKIYWIKEIAAKNLVKIYECLNQELTGSVNNKISIDCDCDCDANPKNPKINNLGIYAFLDSEDLDKCCYDEVMNSNDPGVKLLINRINEKHGTRIIEYAEELGLGSTNYEILNIDK